MLLIYALKQARTFKICSRDNANNTWADRTPVSIGKRNRLGGFYQKGLKRSSIHNRYIRGNINQSMGLRYMSNQDANTVFKELEKTY